MTDRINRLKELCSVCVKTGRVVLTSGKVSDFYFNGKLVMLDPEGADILGQVMYEKAKALGATAIAGMSVGGDPLVSTTGHVAYLDEYPLKMVYVRKAAKEHGAKSKVEGPPLSKDDKVVILEDVVTTGGSSMKAVDGVREAFDCEIAGIIAILDRLEGGREFLEGEKGIHFESIFVKSDFL